MPGIADGKPAREDAIDELWRRYYAGIFNPARLKPKAMRAQMPHNLAEAALIPTLCQTVQARTRTMLDAGHLAAVTAGAEREDPPRSRPADRCQQGPALKFRQRGLRCASSSYLLRLPDEAARAAQYRAFVADREPVAALAPLAGAG